MSKQEYQSQSWHFSVWVLLCWLCFTTGAQAQKESNWRTFRPSDGLFDSLSTSISLSPQGNIWVRHGELNVASRLDGHSTTNIPSLGGGNFRIYESRSGQIWSLYSAGLAEFRDGGWFRYPIESIRLELQTNLIRQVRPIPLLPAERDHVFFLLSDKLVEFISMPPQINVILQAADTGLERFYDLVEMRDGSVWLTGAKGVIKLPGPSRSLNAAVSYSEYLCPPEFEAQNFLRPVEGGDGGITMLGDLIGSSERLLIHFNGREWQRQKLGGEKVRYAWRQADDDYWVITINGIFRFRNGVKTSIPRDNNVTGQMYDMVRESEGVFWLATSEGVVRHVPSLWREPENLHSRELAFHTARADRDGVLWFVAADGLHRFVQERWTRYAWPLDFEAVFQPTDGLYEMAANRLIVSGSEATLQFDLATERFSIIPAPSNSGHWQVKGQFLNGDLCVLTTPVNAEGKRLLRFDGQDFQQFLDLPPTNQIGGEIFFFRELESGDIWLGETRGWDCIAMVN